jgi:2-dehydro-3-deoxyphosphogluconate aldolase/(4S)-4-hydroxy-2-oxoglutarate aldolase
MQPAGQTILSESFAAFPVVGILRGFGPELTAEIGQVAAVAGLTAIEVTLNSPGALEQIRILRQALGTAIAVGAGTVLDAEDARQALAAGAQFLVSPGLDAGMMAAGRAAGVPLFPGALTPTEVLAAWRAGATMVKLFPAGALGPAYLKAIKAPLGHIPLLPTGGIGLQNAEAFLDAGADGFGIGEPLFERERILQRDWTWLRERIGCFRRLFEERRRRAEGEAVSTRPLRAERACSRP